MNYFKHITWLIYIGFNLSYIKSTVSYKNITRKKLLSVLRSMSNCSDIIFVISSI